MNILEDLQNYVADRLNADPQLSACPFLVENRRDVDFQIKQALGKQGIVGLVMTPKATFAGAYMDVGIAWQVDQLEIDVVENVLVNRGKKDGYVTGQDAAMRLFEVLCPLSGDDEGTFCPVSYEEGEDNSLLVNRAVLKCLVHRVHIPAKTVATFADGTSRSYDVKGTLEIDWLGPGVYPGDVVDVQIGEEVTGLGERSFTGFGQLSSIVVPKNVTSIGMEAFSWTGLTSVVIENGVTELGYGTFAYSNGLSSLILPSTLTKIGADVFEECGSLHSVSIPKSVVDISQVAFRYSHLTELTMVGRTKAEVRAMENFSWGLQNGCVIHCTDGDIVVGAETVVQYADSSVSRLNIEGQLTHNSIPNIGNATSVQIGSHVTSIGNQAFAGCSGLTSVTIGNSVLRIEDYAFAGCSGLTNVAIPNSVTSIGTRVFEACTSLTSMTIGNSVTSIGSYAFSDCHSLSSVMFDGKTLYEISSMDNYPWGIADTNNIHNIIGPDTRVKYGWSQSWDSLPLSGTLNSNDLPNRDGINYIGIGSSIDEIGERAFRGMEFLIGVEIPTTVTAIGAQAFSGAEGMTDIEIPSSVSSIGSDAFYGCHSLSSVMFDGKTIEQVQAMDNYPWALQTGCVVRCTDGDVVVGSETKVTYRNGDVVEYDIDGELRRGQLSGLTSIVSLDIGRGVTGLATNAFYSCVNLSSVTIPNSVSGVGGAAFMNCYRLSAVALPDSVTSMDGSVFQGCTALMDASLGDGLSAVPEGTFYGCTRLSSVVLPQNAAYVGEGAFEACTALRSIDIPDSVSSLNNSAFGRCANLASVRMPSSLTAIYEYAFDRCGALSSVVIPEGVAYIGADAFIGCTGVVDVYCYPRPDQLNWDEADKDDFKPDGSTVCHVRPGYLDGYVSRFGGSVNVTFAGDLTAD